MDILVCGAILNVQSKADSGTNCTPLSVVFWSLLGVSVAVIFLYRRLQKWHVGT